MDNDTIEGVVQNQIAVPRRPTSAGSDLHARPSIVTGQDAEDVAAYVASVAGVPGIKPPIAPGGPGGQVFAQRLRRMPRARGGRSAGQVGPTSTSVPGQDAAAVEESIVDPSADISSGFDGGIDDRLAHLGGVLAEQRGVEVGADPAAGLGGGEAVAGGAALLDEDLLAGVAAARAAARCPGRRRRRRRRPRRRAGPRPSTSSPGM